MRTGLLAITILAAVFAIGCADKPTQYQKDFTKEEESILASLKQYTFHELQYLNHKKVQNGDTNAINTLSRNNSLWISLYETSQRPKETYALQSRSITTEGDPFTTYYLAENGIVRRIMDCSRDKFAGIGVSEERLEPFLIGYTGYNLPCPCGSGRTWLDCSPGQCRRPTFVIVESDFPKDEVLHWIPPPREDERSMTWKYGPNKPDAGDGK